MRSWGLDRFRRLRDATCRDPRGAEEGGPAPGAPSFRRYEVRGVLGEGATAVVYRAWDRELQRTVALKVLRTVLGSGDAGERFRREARAAAGLSHPNLIGVYDAGQEAGAFFIVMELVEGRSLGDILRAGALSDRDAARLLEKAARGVAAAHERGIVHRDLKPANLLVSESGEPKVGDFGLARMADAPAELTRTGSRLGTPLYMAPEQVEGRGREAGPPADVYALGAILYETLTGRPPHEAEGIAELYRKILEEEPARPSKRKPTVSADLETIVLKAVEKDPGRRYPNAGEFADDLRRFLGGEPIFGRPPAISRQLYAKVRKKPWIAATAATVAFAAVVVAWVWQTQSARAGGERESRLRAVRDLAQTSVDAALRLRRAGDNAAMRRYLGPLESAYRQAVESSPGLAEVDYLMGRMHRALMQDERALEFQERAIGKDPRYAPALYERAVLASRRYGREVGKALNTTLVWVHSARPGPVDRPLEAERARPELRAIREGIIRDCQTLAGVVRGGGAAGVVSEANVAAAEGILAYQLDRLTEAQRFLRDALAKDPLMEEAWEALSQTLEREAELLEKEEEKEGKWGEAERTYGEGLGHDKGYLPFLWGRGKLRAARGLRRRHRPETELPELARAEEDFLAALRIDRDAARTWELLGNVRAHRGFHELHTGGDPLPEFARAESDLSEALARNGESTEGWIWRGIVRNHTGVYRSGHGQDPSGVWRGGEEDIGRAIGLEPSDPDAWLERGILRTHRAQYLGAKAGADARAEFDRAENDLTESLRLNAASGETWSARGKVRGGRGRSFEAEGLRDEAAREYRSAIPDYEEAARIDPSETRRATEALKDLRSRLAALEKK